MRAKKWGMWPGQKKPRRKYFLTFEQWAARRRRALELRPWDRSTGPKSFLGKKRASQNAIKHGLYMREFEAASTARPRGQGKRIELRLARVR